MGQTSINKRNLTLVLAAFIVIALIIAIVVPLSLRSDDDDSDESKSSQDSIIDCYPESEGNPSLVDQTTCIKRGCRFNPTPPTISPACVYQNGQYGLVVTDVQDRGQNGLQAKLSQKGQAPFGGDIKEWILSVKGYGDNILRLTFEAVESSRYRVPIDLNLVNETYPLSSTSGFNFQITDKENIGFKITRKSTGTIVWETPSMAGSLVLSDQFLQIMTKLPSTNVYGLGEHSHTTFRHDLTKTWPAFSRDQAPPWNEGANLYGVHPFYTCVEDDGGNTHGVFLLNSNAQEYGFTILPSLTFRTIGGILDFFMFLGPSPEQVVQQYTGVIGRPMMPPYWALGFQLCRYGYNNISNLQDAVESTKLYQIPHDVQYADIDHMDTRNIFTVDEENFPGLNDYFKSLRDGGMRIIYILDPCMISNLSDYMPYQKMAEIDGNIKWADTTDIPSNYTDSNGAILGYVWPQGPVVFPDYFKQKTKEVWQELIVNHSTTLVFDGLWIDMNEPASFGTNEERPFNWPEDVKPYFSLQCPNSLLDDPPYRTKVGYMWDSNSEENPKHGRLSDKSICMATVQGDNAEFSHYDVHSLYGYSQSEPTLRAARNVTGERSIVISRSTFPGSGKYVGHWLGDNESRWNQLHRSIIGMMEFSLFGIPYIGADICGFFLDTTPKMCKRWMQLGAFYPYSRNHNGINYINQGPGQLGDEVGIASRDIMRERYILLPYLYLLFYEAHTTGSTVVRPLHHEYPTDAVALSIDKQFMWGSCLMISPILEEDQTELTFYLPQGRWYGYIAPDKYAFIDMTSGQHQTVNISHHDMPWVHLKGGCILTRQQHANNTYFSRQEPLKIMAALDKNGNAQGQFYWDDGVSIMERDDFTYYMAELQVQNDILSWSIINFPGQQSWLDLTIYEITVLGLDKNVTEVTRELTTDQNPQQTIETFSQNGHELTVILNQTQVLQNFTLTWK